MKKLAALVVLALSMLLIPVTTFSDVDLSPVGRWSVDSDYSTMHDNYMFAKTDFFFFEDGSIYRVSITKKRKENRESPIPLQKNLLQVFGKLLKY